MYLKTVLDNGVRIVTEQIPQTHTVCVGVWVEVGARDEHSHNNGCAHFVEHMLFKGTGSRTARQIAREFDLLGGMSNAFTTNETTCFYATVLDSSVAALADLLSDMFLYSSFLPDEVERERQVILQEISMVDDTPDDRIHELFMAALWGGHPLGQTVLGPRQVVAALDAGDLRGYVNRFYRPDKILIAAAGNIDHQEFRDLWQDRFVRLSTEAGQVRRRTTPESQPPRRLIYRKPLEQVHMVLGTYGLPIAAEERYALLLFNIMLGGNMSSRLFQEIRENRGLAYSVYSYLIPFVDCGAVGIYLGVAEDCANQALALVREELVAFCERPVSGEELDNARQYARGGLYLAADNMETRMTRLARNEFGFGRFVPLSEISAGLDRVSTQDIRVLAGRLFRDQKLTAVGLGPLDNDQVDWGVLD